MEDGATGGGKSRDMILDAKSSGIASLFLSGFLALAGCGGSPDSGQSGASASPTPTPVPVTMGSLALSRAATFEIPAALHKAAATDEELTLTAGDGKHPSAACHAVENLSRNRLELNRVGVAFCHLEKESDRLEVGVKYNVILKQVDSSESERIQLWVDDSNPEKISVYQCRDWTLVNRFEIAEVTEAGIKGSGTMKYTGEDSVVTAVMNFDTSVAGSKSFKISSLVNLIQGQASWTYRNHSELNLSDGGVSSAGASISGSLGDGVTLTDRYLTKWKDGAGLSVMVADGVLDGVPYSRATRAFFDSLGLINLAIDPLPELVIANQEIPVVLDDSFNPDAPTGWDCADGTTVTIDLTDPGVAARHESCVATFLPPVIDCRDGAIYDDGTEDPALRD